MYIPNWGEEVMTGNPQIDEEHRVLFSKIDMLMVAMSHSREQAIIQETLNFLIEYARDHFIEEEKLHSECRAPNLNGHRAAHQKIAKDLKDILEIYHREGLTPHMEFRLVNHVIRGIVDQLHEFDLPLAQFIQGKNHLQSLHQKP